MLRYILFITLIIFSGLTLAAGTPGTIEYFIHNSVDGKPHTIGRIPNHPWPTTTSSPPFTMSTMTRPIGSTRLPTYMPQRISPASFARGMFNAIVNGHPLAKAAVISWAVYECATAESGLCSGGPQSEPTCPDGGSLTDMAGQMVCSVPAGYGNLYRVSASGKFGEATNIPAAASAYSSKRNFTSTDANGCQSSGTWTYTTHNEYGSTSFNVYYTSSQYVENLGCQASPGFPRTEIAAASWVMLEPMYYCPPDENPDFISVYGSGSNTRCFKPVTLPPVKDVTLDDLKSWIAERPNIFNDLSDDILKNPNTAMFAHPPKM